MLQLAPLSSHCSKAFPYGLHVPRCSSNSSNSRSSGSVSVGVNRSFGIHRGRKRRKERKFPFQLFLASCDHTGIQGIEFDSCWLVTFELLSCFNVVERMNKHSCGLLYSWLDTNGFRPTHTGDYVRADAEKSRKGGSKNSKRHQTSLYSTLLHSLPRRHGATH